MTETLPRRSRIYPGWIQVFVAALAMVGTLPGRTQGLGLVTEPLTRDLGLSQEAYASLNLWATFAGALAAAGVGRLIDRFGARVVLSAVAAALGTVTVWMAGARSAGPLALQLTLTRALGQGALSVVSAALVGKWFRRGLNRAMAVYSVALSIGFMVAFPLVGAVVTRSGWRAAWGGVGWGILVGLAPALWLLARPSPEACGLPPEGEEPGILEANEVDFTLAQALGTPAFWAVGVGSALYALVASGIGLFNESVLKERGFAPAIYYNTLAVTALTSLIGNFLGGWFTGGRPIGRQTRLMGAAMLLLALALAALPLLRTVPQVMAMSVVFGVAGGFVIVVFFAFWGRAYGRAQLGRVQGVAQALTVLASAVGPLLLARCYTLTGSYATGFYALAIGVALTGVAACVVPPPRLLSDATGPALTL